MSTERTSKKRARPEDDDCIEFIDREDIIDIEKLTSDDTNDEILDEHAFDKLFNKENSINNYLDLLETVANICVNKN